MPCINTLVKVFDDNLVVQYGPTVPKPFRPNLYSVCQSSKHLQQNIERIVTLPGDLFIPPLSFVEGLRAVLNILIGGLSWNVSGQLGARFSRDKRISKMEKKKRLESNRD